MIFAIYIYIYPNSVLSLVSNHFWTYTAGSVIHWLLAYSSVIICNDVKLFCLTYCTREAMPGNQILSVCKDKQRVCTRVSFDFTKTWNAHDDIKIIYFWRYKTTVNAQRTGSVGLGCCWTLLHRLQVWVRERGKDVLQWPYTILLYSWTTQLWCSCTLIALEIALLIGQIWVPATNHCYQKYSTLLQCMYRHFQTMRLVI